MVARRNRINSLAGLLLLGGSILKSGSMLKAAEKYFPGSPKEIEQQVIKCYKTFQDELKSEIDERRKDPVNTRQRYLMDLMLEDMLGYSSSCSQDLTIEYQKELGEFVTDIYKSAINKSLKKFEWYNDLKENVKSKVFGLGDQKEDNVSEDNANRYNLNFLADRGIKTEINPSLRGGEFNVSACAALKKFKLLGVGFDGGQLEVGTNKLRVCLEKAISDEIFSRFNIELDELKKPNVSLSLTGERNKGRWVVSVGCHNNSKEDAEVYTTLGYIQDLF